MKVEQFLIGIGAVAVAAIGGCGQAMMNVEDVVIARGQGGRFVVSIDREYMKPSVMNVDVSIMVNGRVVGRGRTDADGKVVVRANVDPGASTYQARSEIDGRTVTGKGRIFHWDPNRTVVAVDVDDTISHTDYSDLFITPFDTTSAPFEGSPRALRTMARDYQILYVSARPRWLHEKTRGWLDRNGFPSGPVLHAPGFDGCFHQAYYKAQMLDEFQREFPSTLVGVGDKLADEKAYYDRHMLAVILGRSDAPYRKHCVVLPDWHAIGQFFDRHRPQLADARRLESVVQASHMNLRPLFSGPSGEPVASADVSLQTSVVQRMPARIVASGE